MKYLFRKATSVLASAALMGMTLGTAAAATYPEPFVENGAGSYAIVVGSAGTAASSDMVAATDIGTSLSSNVVAEVVTGETPTGGDSFQYQLGTNTLFQLGKGALDIISTSLDDSDLTTVLADGRYIDNDNDGFDYSQSIKLTNLTLDLFDDDDYKTDTPTVGFSLSDGTVVLNYTLDFSDYPIWGDLQNSNLELLGKDFYVSQTNTTSSYSSMTLLDSANEASIEVGDLKTITVDGKPYEISASVFDTTNNKVKLIVNGVATRNLLGAGDVEDLGDGVYLGVKTVVANAYTGGVQYAEISIGSGKLELIDTQEIKLNDKTLSDAEIKSWITLSSGSLQKIVLEWTIDGDDQFVTEDSTVIMPAFDAVKLVYTGMDYPSEETIQLNDGSSDYMMLDNFPTEMGELDLNILYFNDSNYTVVGKDDEHRLLTTAATTFTYDADTWTEGFVASWTDGRNSESYLLRATSFSENSAKTENSTKIQYNDGTGWKDKDTVKYSTATATDSFEIGSLVLTTGAIDDDLETIEITRGSTGSFKDLYSKEGLKVYLPYTNTTDINLTALTGTAYGTNSSACAAALALSGGATVFNGTITEYNTSGTSLSSTGCSVGPDTFNLIFSEEDKTGNVGLGGNITVTIGDEGDSTEVSAYTVAITGGRGSSSRYEIGDTDVFRSFAYSDLATEVLEDESSQNRETVKLIYHGDESSGKFYVTSVQTSFGSESGTVVPIYDNEAEDAGEVNLVVVGGSCVNTVAATLLGSNVPLCEAEFTAKTSVNAGEYLIETFASPYSSKIATLVAGYNAADTANAANALTTSSLDITEEVKYKGTTASDVALVA
ncbi:MAG: hypothetical protein U9Q06_01610 [Nanoarchaeota archaeon]|nr:hypothetical protein [Nanoarchaeota archaeon]